MFIDLLFKIILRSGNNSNVQLLMDLLTKKKHIYIHTVKYLATKINEVLIYATTWVNPENIMLSERNPVTKDHI